MTAESTAISWEQAVREPPKGWTKKTLGQLFHERVETGRPHLELLSVTSDRGVIPRNEVGRRDSSSPNKSKYLRVLPGDIVYNTMRMWQGVSGLCDKEGIVSPAYTVCQPTDLIDPRYALFLLKSPPLVRAFHAQSQGLVSDTLNLKFSLFSQVGVAVPPLCEQGHIAEILTSIDRAIQETQACLSRMNRLQRLLTAELLVGEAEIERRTPTERGKISNAWRLKTVGELCTLSNGRGFSSAEWSPAGLPIIRIQNLNGSRSFNFWSGEVQESWLVEPGDLLFAWAGVRGFSFGPCLWPGPRGVLNQHIFRVRESSDLSREFLFLLLEQVTARIETRAHGFKSSLLHVRKGDITSQVVALPPRAEQDRIVETWQASKLATDREASALAQLTTLKSALLNDLLTGRVRVKVPS